MLDNSENGAKVDRLERKTGDVIGKKSGKERGQKRCPGCWLVPLGKYWCRCLECRACDADLENSHEVTVTGLCRDQ